MRLTVSVKHPSLQRIFNTEQLKDSVLDADELASVGISDAMLSDLGFSQATSVTTSQADRLLGAVLHRTTGQKVGATRDERRLDADIIGAYATYSGLSGEPLKALLTPLLTLPLDRKRRVLPLLSSMFGDDYWRGRWLRDSDTAGRAGELVAALTKVAGFKAAGVAFFAELPTDPAASVELFQSLIARYGYSKERLYTSGRALPMLVEQGVTSLKAQRDALLFLDRNVSRDDSQLANLHAQHVRFAELSEQNLVTEIAKAAAGLYPRSAAMLINEIHDLQGGNDSYRRGIVAALSEQATLNILADATDEIYNSTYLLMLANVRAKNPDVGAWLRAQNPTPTQLDGVCKTLSRFRQIDVIAQAGDLFAGTIMDGLNATRYWGSNPSRYIPLALAILRDGTPAAKTKLEALLVATVEKNRAANPAAAIVLRTAFDEGLTKSPVAAALPPRPKLEAPINEWLADGAVTAVLFCYTESGGSDPGGIAMHYLNAGFIEAPGKTLFGLNKRQTRVLERTVQGVVQRIVITTDATRDRDEVIRDKGVDIVVHRGHSYQLDKTFPQSVTSDPNGKRKLLFGGSCSSFGDMTASSFQAAYGEHLILSDFDTGQARVNNPTLLKVLDGAAARKKSFSSYGLSASDGLILPDSPEQQVIAYEHALSPKP